MSKCFIPHTHSQGYTCYQLENDIKYFRFINKRCKASEKNSYKQFFPYQFLSLEL